MWSCQCGCMLQFSLLRHIFRERIVEREGLLTRMDRSWIHPHLGPKGRCTHMAPPRLDEETASHTTCNMSFCCCAKAYVEGLKKMNVSIASENVCLYTTFIRNRHDPIPHMTRKKSSTWGCQFSNFKSRMTVSCISNRKRYGYKCVRLL